METRLPRKLAAILYGDVAGYSRLTGEDEEGTHRRLSDYLDLISDAIVRHRGSVVHYAGDAVLADFGTVTEALTCATHIQSELADRNRELPDERKVQFRIGINLGEVIVDRNDIYGDGVNVAARLESLADPGGICVSESVRTAAGKKLNLRYEDMGQQEVKNIADPVRCFRVRFGHEDDRVIRAVPIRPAAAWANEVRNPSVVVRPFRFIGDPGKHEYLATAITEGIASALAHFREYNIVEGNDAIAATYALDGTLQTAGRRIRVSPQLSSIRDGRKLWAEKFDRLLEDVFELQDEISAIVAGYLGEAIWQETARALVDKSEDDYTALDWCYHATECIHRLTQQGMVDTKAACEKAMALDSDLLLAKRLFAFALALEISFGWAMDPSKAEATALALTRELLLKDPTNAQVHRVAARVYTSLARHAEALAHSEQSTVLNPYNGDNLITHGVTLIFCGQAVEAIPWIEKALRYNPKAPIFYRQSLVLAEFLAGGYAAALENLCPVESGFPFARFIRIAVLQASGRHEEAAAEVDSLLSRHPEATVHRAVSTMGGYKNPADVEAVRDALRDAGLPDGTDDS